MTPPAHRDPTPWAVFLIFLRLGLTSFGGPVAHLAYFRDEFVTRRRWLSERSYADLLALCQFLPGPASSQVGMALGLGRCGYLGALAAWVGFTLPSAVLLMLLALGITEHGDAIPEGAVHGLKVVAVAVVAQAVWGMGRNLCPDAPRVAIMAVAAGLALLAPLPGARWRSCSAPRCWGCWCSARPRVPPMTRCRSASASAPPCCGWGCSSPCWWPCRC
ncbi:hypothetical protein PSm6_56030 [Pseudomonas solani]|uniref:Chromate transporter n=1 Tax=Pseudomonas solani TaxID=2731552 RepID=A0ABN6C398_9PSED|nr:hypothetical protein PSm6_56030 [Pseudomonas solani]